MMREDKLDGTILGDRAVPVQPRALVVARESNLTGIVAPPGYAVLGSVGTAEAAASIIPVLKPDVILVDKDTAGLPGFTEMINLVRAAFPSIRVEPVDRRREGPGDMATVPSHNQQGALSPAVGFQPGARGVIALWSPKGGVGRTFLVCNLAACVSTRGRHGVVLIDLDLKWGDAGVHLGVNDGTTILDALPYLDDAVPGSIRRFTVNDKRSGVSALLAPGRPELSDLVSPGQVKRAVTLAKADFEFVFVDSPADAGPDFLMETLEDSSTIIAVTTQDVAGLRRVKMGIDLAKKARGGTGHRFIIVVNQAFDSSPATVSHVESFLEARVSGVVPWDRPAVESSIYEGVPLVVSNPGHRVSRAIAGIAASLCPGIVIEPANNGNRFMSSIRSIVERRVRAGRRAGDAGETGEKDHPALPQAHGR